MTALEQLRDAFEDAAATAALWTLGSNVTSTAGALRVATGFWDSWDTFPTGSQATSRAVYDLTGSSLTVELVQAASGGSSTELWAGVYTDAPGGTGLRWRVSYSSTTGFLELQAVRRAAGADTQLLALPYSAQRHRWLRITEDAGSILWDASPDGFEWSRLATTAPGIAVGAVRVVLSAFYSSPGDVGGGAALFDNVNLLPGALDVATITGNPGDPYLAVDVRPDYAVGTFTLDSSQLDLGDRLAWSDTDPGAWASIVCDVTRLNYRRGASRLAGLFTRTEAGTATVTLLDTLHAFDPLVNAESIHKGTPFRVRAWGYDSSGDRWDAVLFTGDVDDVGVRYQKADSPVVTITVVDLVGPLTAWQSEGLEAPGVGLGDNLLQRVQRVLATVGRGEVDADSDAVYSATLAPTRLQKAWQELQDDTEAELGRLWVDSRNRLVVRARGSQLVGPVRGTLSDVHDEAPIGAHCCVADAAVVFGTELLANRVLAKRRIATTTGGEVAAQVTLNDDASQARYGISAVDRTGGLELATDDQLQPWAGAVITGHTKPELRVDSVQPAPSPTDLDSALTAWPAVLQTDLGDRWLFRYHPTVGPAVERAVGVLGIEVDASPDGWTVRWSTESAPAPGAANPLGWFVLDLSQLDGGDLLAPYPYPAPAPA